MVSDTSLFERDYQYNFEDAMLGVQSDGHDV